MRVPVTGRVLFVGAGVEAGGLGALESHFEVDVAEGAVDAIKQLSAGATGPDCVVAPAAPPDLALDEFLARVQQFAPGAASVVVGPLSEEPEAAEAVVDADAYVPPGRESTLARRVRGVIQDRRIDRALDRHDRLTRAVAKLAVEVGPAVGREAIEEALYDALIGDDVYEQAWVARVIDDDAFEVTVPVRARLGEADLRDIAGDAGPAFAEEALRHRRVVATDGPAPTRSAAAATAGEAAAGAGGGLESAIVPLLDAGDVHGVALVSTGRTDAFDAAERDLLADLGAVVGRALATADAADDLDDPADGGRMGTLVHELRNPLSIAQSHLEIAREDGDERSFEHVGDALARMGEIIDRVAADAVGGRTARMATVDLAEVAEEAWGTVSAPAATLEVVETRSIRADRELLRRLLTNLLQNAVDHGGEGVTVRVGTTPDGFYVEDDGPGIPPGDHQSVFARGYTTAEDGLGLGLSIVQGAVDAHEWSLDVTKADAGGARFEVGDVRAVAEEDPMEGNEPS